MTKAPLKTAARALSFATIVAAGFATWVVGHQAFTPPNEPPSPTETTVQDSAEAVIHQHLQTETAVAQAQPSLSDDGAVAKSLPKSAAKLPRQPETNKSVNEFAHHAPPKPALKAELFFEAEPLSEKPSRSHSERQRPLKPKSQENDLTFDELPINRDRLTSATTLREPLIQPPFGRASAQELERPQVASTPLDESDDDEEQPPLHRLPMRSSKPNVPTQQASRNKDVGHDLQKAFDAAASSRLESRLLTMQRQLDQFAQAQTEQKADDLQQARELLDQLQRERDTDKLDKVLQDIKDMKEQRGKQKSEPTAPVRKPDDPFEAEPPAEEAPPTTSRKPGVLKAAPVEGQSDRFSIEFQDVEISKAMAMLGQLSGMNILIGRGVTGIVPTANLQDVTAEEALDAITKSLNYTYEKEGNIVFISTASDAMQRKQSARKMLTKVFRPRYISVKDLQALITPLLSKPGGLIAVTTPAEVGLEESKTKGGGNSLSQTDALLVVDYPEVLAQVDLVITEIDVPPAQVVIEAMILSVNLTESMKLGVNFALLGGNNKQLVTSGNGAQIVGNVGIPNNSPNKSAILPAAGDFIASTAGLKYGFLTGDVAGFVEALETLADTSVVASPSVRVLNKQRAELIIGKRLGYTTTTFNGTQSIQNINFLEVGTKLILRPYVADDGLVRMEIHPERSDGEVVDGLPNSRTTEVTSNVMVRDGTTIVIGGLIEEQATQSSSRIPGLGALPVVGNLFKSKSNNTQRTELIVLLTPRVIHEVDAACEGEEVQAEGEVRHEQFRNRMSKIGRTNLASIEFERAARKYEEGDYDKAHFHIEQSLRQNRLDLDALRLKEQIDSKIEDRNRWFRKPRRKPPVEYHRTPSDASASPSLPPDAFFDQEFSIPTQTPSTPKTFQPLPIPPVPAPTTDR